MITKFDQVAAIFEKKLMITTTDYNETMNELKKIYWHEKQLLIAIPMLISYATTFELVESLTVLSKYTHAHIKLLEEQFPEIDRETLPE